MTDTYAAPMSKRQAPTRERILDAALELFMQRGVAGTTVSDIERAVGLAAGTGSFYRHFRSKEDLVVPAFEHGLARARKRLDAARAADGAVGDSHERTFRDYRTMLSDMEHIHPLWLLLLSERDHYPELQDVFIDSLGMREWELRWEENRVRTVIIAALTGFHQLAMLDEVYYGTIDPDDFVAALVELTEIVETRMTALGRAQRVPSATSSQS